MGEFVFQLGVGGVAGFIFEWGDVPLGASILMGGFSKKMLQWGGGGGTTYPCPPTKGNPDCLYSATVAVFY